MNEREPTLEDSTLKDGTLEDPKRAHPKRTAPGEQLGLVVVWAEAAPSRLGEVLLPGAEPAWFGREVESVDAPRLRLLRQRPGKNQPSAPETNPFLSRRQLCVERLSDETLRVCSGGKRRLKVGNRNDEELRLRAGDSFELEGLYAFLCVERPPLFDAAQLELHEFGGADAAGLVGESPALWSLRKQLGFVAERVPHVLVTGPSGTGKELVARALHAASNRHKRALISRNAATFPSGLIDAELFGNVANYPNSGMPQRPGLIGQADGSTLFLDEIGELPSDLQAHLLRVLDSGEYQRLGDAHPHTANLRLVAATNRDPAELKHDLAARLALRIHLPGLDERLEDVPLIARHLVRRIATRDAAIGERYLEGWNGRTGEPRFSVALALALVRHQFSTHVRELEGLLWRSMQSSPGGVLDLTDEVRSQLKERPSTRVPREITASDLRAALARHGGTAKPVCRELGLSDRHVLRRLMRKLGVTSDDARDAAHRSAPRDAADE